MKKEIIINASIDETRIAILEENQLTELYVERPDTMRMVGDIYLGKIENVVKAIQAAFVNIGLKQNGFLPFTEIGKEYFALTEKVDSTKDKRKTDKQTQAQKFKLKPGQKILVQITKEPISTKGSRLTSSISLPGRYLVLIPNENHIGISRKIKNRNERQRLRRICKSLQPKGFGLIIRTVAIGKEIQPIKSDLENLLKTWDKIEKKASDATPPNLIYKDMGFTSSLIRDLFSPDIHRVVVDSRKLFREIKKYLKEVSPNLLEKLEFYKEKKPIFDSLPFHSLPIEDAIEKSLSRKIWIRGGGYIIFDQTEAMVVIDVNSGSFVSEKDQEKNALKTNIEAAKEITHQLRLRDLGGIIVIDFIDMSQKKNREKLVANLNSELKKDRAAFDILPMSDFGVVELTRERVRPSLLYQYSEPCPRCNGIGRVSAKSTIITKIERGIQKIKYNKGQRRLVLKIHPDMADYLTKGFNNHKNRLIRKYFINLKIIPTIEMDDKEFELIPKKDYKKEK